MWRKSGESKYKSVTHMRANAKADLDLRIRYLFHRSNLMAVIKPASDNKANQVNVVHLSVQDLIG